MPDPSTTDPAPRSGKYTGNTALFGGSFDPPHTGHQLAVCYLLHTLGFDRVWVAPVFAHPFGKELSPFEQRLSMCRVMCGPLGERAEVVDAERHNPTGFTFDLLECLAPRTSLVLVVGADVAQETPKWHRWRELSDRWPVVILGRGGVPGSHAPALPAISSTDLRRRLAQGDACDGLIPVAVLDHIADNDLYR